MKRQIPERNRSRYGWWLAVLLIRYQERGEDLSDQQRRCVTWENTILIKAGDREEAYRKAVRRGRLEHSEGWDCIDEVTRKKGRWVFEGLASLMPVYERLTDGAEILWHEHRVSVKRVKSLVRAKKDLEAFQD